MFHEERSIWIAMLTFVNFCRILIVIYVLSKPSTAAINRNYSNSSTNKEFCYFKSLSKSEKMAYCKFECWKNSYNHVPTNARILRNSIVSLNIQITGKNCSKEIDLDTIHNMKNLSVFVVNGHLNSFNLTSLLTGAANLKRLMLASSDLNHVAMDNLPNSKLTSISIVGGFDPKKWQFIKSSRTTLKSFYLALNRKVTIPENLFSNMPEIEFIVLHILSEKMSANSFSNLPKLVYLSVNNNYFNLPIKFQKHVFSNLPALKTLKIINFEIETNNTDDRFCSQISDNIHHFTLELSSILFIEKCIDVWRCVECGNDDGRAYQTMEFKSLLFNYKPQYQTRLDDILPSPENCYYLNTSRLILIDTHIPMITSSSLMRLPMLTHYHHHRSWRLHENSKPLQSLGDIDRFDDNPFEQILKMRSKLTEVKISIWHCDCVCYSVYQFLISHNVSVRFYCRNLALDFDSVNIDSWISGRVFVEIMERRCTNNSAATPPNTYPGNYSNNSTDSSRNHADELSTIYLGLLSSCLYFLLYRFY